MIAPLLSLLPLLAPQAQEPGPDANRTLPVLSVDELVLRYFVPEHASASRLSDTLWQLVGREFYVLERGGYASEKVDDLFELGGQIGVYDTEEYVNRVLALAGELDRESASRAQTAGSYVTRTYTPRFVTLDLLDRALQPFVRQILVGDEWAPNVTSVRDRGLLVLRDEQACLDEMLALLASLDVPERQVRLTCWLVSGVTNAGNDPSLPKELVQDLGKLMPGMGFQARGFAMLNTTASVERPRSVQLESDSSFQFLPSAYDGETGTLTVASCALQSGGRELFSTSAVFRGGEFTVVGAVGADPVFLVVRVTPG